MSKIYLNGKIVEEKDATISVRDRSYLFGEGVFETIRSYNGKVPFLDKHLHRMEWSASFIGLPFPHPKEITEGVYETLKANQLQNSRVKIVLSSAGHGMTPTLLTDDIPINLMITAEKLQALKDSDYEEGVEITFLHSIPNNPPPLCTVKSTSYLSRMIANREIAEKSCFDGVMMNAQGFIAETAKSNIFWVQNETLFTPPPNAGILSGITRNVVIGLAKDEGIEVREKLITEEQLKEMPEIFLTNSIIELMPVTEIDGQAVGTGEVGKTTRKLQEAYSARIREEFEDE